MASSVLRLIKNATAKAIESATFVNSGQSLMRQVCDVGAKAAGISTTDVRNGKYEGFGASYFEHDNIFHYFTKQSNLLVYIIVRKDTKGKETTETVYSMKMPTAVEGGGEASTSSSNKKKT